MLNKLLIQFKRYYGWTVEATLWSGQTARHVTWGKRATIEWVLCYPAELTVSLSADRRVYFTRKEG